jgi:hypothetical protein
VRERRGFGGLSSRETGLPFEAAAKATDNPDKK